MSYKKIQLLFLGSLLQLVAPVSAIDRLAADDTSAAYRSGAQDEKSMSVPVEIVEAIGKNPETGLPLLVNFLTDDTTDEFLKVKRLHDWITENIAYDSDLLLGLSDQGSRKVIDLVKFKRTTCGGFAGLFLKMAELAKLTAERIEGNSKTCWIKSAKRDCHHVWNAVKVRDKWYVVDTTADSRFTFKFGKFTPRQKYRDVWLFIRPEAKLLINLPLEERQQFMANPISREQFLKTPRVSASYLKYDLTYSAETIAQFYDGKRDFEGGALQKVFDMADSKNEIFELRFTAPANISFFPQLVKEPQESFDDTSDSDKHQKSDESDEPKVDLNARAFCFREGAQVVCQYSAAAPGKYKAFLRAREAGDQHKFALIHAFTLVAEKAGPILPQAKNQLYTNALFDLQSFRINASDFSQDAAFPSIEVERPAGNFITSFVFGQDGKRVPASVEYSFLSPQRLKFYYKFAAAGTYWVRLQTRVPDKAGVPVQNVGVVRLEITKASERKFPPPNELVLTKQFSEEKLSFQDSNIADRRGDVIVNTTGATEKILECLLYDVRSKAIANSCNATTAADRTTFHFTVTTAGEFGGRIFYKVGSKQKILGYFKIER